MKHAKTLALAVLLSALFVLSASYYWPVQEAYHPLNTDWNGCSSIYNSSENSHLVFDYSQPLSPTSSVLTLIGPSTAFSPSEVRVIEQYLLAGGLVLLADDFGTGNSLLQGLNASARFSREPLDDLLFYSRNENFPLIVNFSQSRITANISSVVMNHPSFIEINDPNNVEAVAWSSPFSFVDLNNTNRPPPNATIEAFPVVAYTQIGEGSLVLVSDPGIFANDLIDLYDNSKLFDDLRAMGNRSVLFDVAHLVQSPLSVERVRMRLGIDAFRDFLGSSMGAYIQITIAIGVIIAFSLEIARRVNKRRILSSR